MSLGVVTASGALLAPFSMGGFQIKQTFI